MAAAKPAGDLSGRLLQKLQEQQARQAAKSTGAATVAGPVRSLPAAIITTVFKLLFFLGIASFGILYFYAEMEGIGDQDWGDIIRYGLRNVFDVTTRSSAEDLVAGTVGIIVAVAVTMTLYFLPTINAGRRNHPHYSQIFIFNMLLGLTGVGWLITLLWSALGGGGDRTPAPGARPPMAKPQAAAVAGPWGKAQGKVPAAAGVASAATMAQQRADRSQRATMGMQRANTDIVMRTRRLPVFWRRAR